MSVELQKPSEFTKFLLSLKIPFGILIKMVITRILETINAIPDGFLAALLEKMNITQYRSFKRDLDIILNDYCAVPSNLTDGLKFNKMIVVGKISQYEIKDLIDRLYSSSTTKMLSDLDNDFLGQFIQEKRKSKKGVVYTPKSIINHICSQIFTYWDGENKKKDDFTNLDMLERLETLTILDPACGSGSFLAKSFEYLCERCINDMNPNVLKQNIKPDGNNPDKNSKITQSILSFALSQCYGIDIDYTAIICARINLWLRILKFLMRYGVEFSLTSLSPQIFSILEKNIIVGDSLQYIPIDPDIWKNESFSLKEKLDRIGNIDPNISTKTSFLVKYFPHLAASDPACFSIILGNPPYVSSKDLAFEYKELLRRLYRTAVHQFDLYSIFIELAWYLLDQDGLFGYIIPESYLGRSSFTESRKMLLKSTKILKIENIQGAFPSKSISNIILYFSKKSPNNQEDTFDMVQYTDEEHFIMDSGSGVSISQNYCSRLENSKILCLPPEIRNIIGKIQQDAVPLGSYIKIHRGEEIGKKSNLILSRPKPRCTPILFGENIKKFKITKEHQFIQLNSIQKKNAYYFNPKVMVRQLDDHIKAAFDEYGEYVTVQTVYNLISTSPSISNEFIVGLLNSDIIQFYYQAIFREKQVFPRILIENIIAIPLIRPSLEIHSAIQECVKKIIKGEKKVRKMEISQSFEQLNQIMFKLYGLDKNEIEIVKKFLKKEN
ncbi:MAG: N-6 DNA methylase [Candidatus Lokiarchaeota archaeon]|nr:N-6 DNA methylase [Candidatus Lokiarchaeota archaeon]